MNNLWTWRGFGWLLTIFICLGCALPARGQYQQVTGKVVSEDQRALPGVSVMVKGTSRGVATGTGGEFSIEAAAGEVLVFRMIGFLEQELSVSAAQQEVTISLAPDLAGLEEVVVVGYGTQQKKLVTGATLQVKGEDLQKQSMTNALQALQGQAPGVQITSTSGQPGEPMRVIVRGLGTISDASPLYIVDGVFTNDISYLNPADIESFDVLKDAASAAIYGSQAANGVVLITTKQGTPGQPVRISFDAYTGLQNVPRKTALLNAREYAAIMNEAAINSGKQPIFSGEEIAGMGTGTSWLNEMFVSDAPTQNYSLSAQGGGEASVYSASLSYTSQQGIVGGQDLSDYKRYNFRINSEHKLYEDKIRIGQNLTFAYTQNKGIQVGNQYNNTLRGAFNTSPFLPMYDEEGNFYDNSESDWYNGEANPYAEMVYNNQNEWNDQRLLGNIYLEAEPLQDLKFRSSFGLDYTAGEGHSYEPEYQLSIYSFNRVPTVDQDMNKGRSLLWNNLLSYRFDVKADHDFEVMLGTEAYEYNGTWISGGNSGFVFNDLRYAWLDNAINASDATFMNLGGAAEPDNKRLSYFGRINYNYKGTYLLNATFRADGSSMFAEGNRWGYFPSVSAGWMLTNEEFMSGQSWVEYFKLRASWGQVGNQNVDAYNYLAPVTFQYTNYTFGPQEGELTPGAYPSRLSNPDLKWETSEQTNIGFDAGFLKGRLNVNFDWYDKTTRDWLVQAPVTATAGAEAPFINGGDVKNTGVELALSYSDQIGNFNYRVGVNGAYNKNTVGRIPTADGIIHGATNQLFANSGEYYRAQDGFPIGYFWGLKTNGIFQSEEEVDAYRSSDGTLIQPGAGPGDVRYMDLNDDGTISDNDRTMIGDPNPDYTFGFTLSANYKGFDFSLLASGVAGNELVQSYRNHADLYANYTTAIFDRWHGPGSSDRIPRVTEDARNWINFSDLYIHEGDYLRINNVTIGYNFSKLIDKRFISQVRLYASVLNLYTFTRYEGMDPEIGYTDDFASGVDVGYYPRPRTWMLGLNVKF